MIDIHTVLVLGAGASIPYGYPSGPGLVKDIIHSLSKADRINPNYHRQLVFMGFQEALISAFINDLMRSNVRSIDEFLECRPDYREIGKIAIAQSIIARERAFSREDLQDRVERGHYIYDKPDFWYAELIRAISGKSGEFVDNNLSIITFNYDRSLEYFLYDALMSKYGKSAEEKVIKTICSLHINHVHGKLGDLPWEGGGHIRAYGAVKSDDELRAVGNLITILYEGERQSQEFERAYQSLHGAQRILFLGFGYHRSNLARLGIDRFEPYEKNILGTRHGIEDLQVKNLARKFTALKDLEKVPKDHCIHDFLQKVINLDGHEIGIA
ncbi:MAG: hypothetical protein A2X28_04000 [Elusimicrobia bacterium GWA2_56_46]|nr:MAG: hypothetical protein A2X28_04000 [Elusimicrobia bacterium GWA2_56_46]OGR56043.1 MAG: hypothetical protein A2X39_07420 [Elusimicrobia bacterium GWC2_56_31]HBB67905.1 hypothetical protein [Elusimicrobiota bacterium]HBW22872.1 hypothetical protein [Elusimicrobiota bacterium]